MQPYVESKFAFQRISPSLFLACYAQMIATLLRCLANERSILPVLNSFDHYIPLHCQRQRKCLFAGALYPIGGGVIHRPEADKVEARRQTEPAPIAAPTSPPEKISASSDDSAMVLPAMMLP